jgi:hypothetical protein
MLVELKRVGWTEGYGHFHLSESLFRRLRNVLAAKNHRYANAYNFGQGPNWRIRLSREGLKVLGLDPNLLRHGISREVYVMPLANNVREFLTGRSTNALLDRPSVCEISGAALTRWIIPRASRRPDYRQFERTEILKMLG